MKLAHFLPIARLPSLVSHRFRTQRKQRPPFPEETTSPVPKFAVINAYKEALYIGKLRGEFLKGAKAQEEIEKAESEYSKLGDNLLSQAKVEIVDPEAIK